MKVCPVSWARSIGERVGANRVVIICLDEDDMYQGASWGKDRRLCRALGKWLDQNAEKVAVDIELDTMP